jgi:hypothetical protein
MSAFTMRSQATGAPSATSRISELFDLGLWSDWFAQLDRGFVFLLVLPFVVAVIGVWASYREKDDVGSRNSDLIPSGNSDHLGPAEAQNARHASPWRGKG